VRTIRKAPGPYQATVRPAPGQHQATVRPAPGQHQDSTRLEPGQHQDSTRLAPGHCQASTRPEPGQHQAMDVMARTLWKTQAHIHVLNTMYAHSLSTCVSVCVCIPYHNTHTHTHTFFIHERSSSRRQGGLWFHHSLPARRCGDGQLLSSYITMGNLCVLYIYIYIYISIHSAEPRHICDRVILFSLSRAIRLTLANSFIRVPPGEYKTQQQQQQQPQQPQQQQPPPRPTEEHQAPAAAAHTATRISTHICYRRAGVGVRTAAVHRIHTPYSDIRLENTSSVPCSI